MVPLVHLTALVLMAGPSSAPAAAAQRPTTERKKVMTARASADDPQHPYDALLHQLPGDAGEVIRSSESIDVLRLGRAFADDDGPAQWPQDLQHRPAPREPAGSSHKLEDWPVLARFSIPAQRARGVTQRLLASNVRSGGTKLCGGFRPGIALRFHRGPSVVDALICFDCDDLQIVLGDEIELYDLRDDAVMPLLAIARELFPDDAGLRELEERRKKVAADGTAAPTPAAATTATKKGAATRP